MNGLKVIFCFFLVFPGEPVGQTPNHVRDIVQGSNISLDLKTTLVTIRIGNNPQIQTNIMLDATNWKF